MGVCGYESFSVRIQMFLSKVFFLSKKKSFHLLGFSQNLERLGFTENNKNF